MILKKVEIDNKSIFVGLDKSYYTINHEILISELENIILNVSDFRTNYPSNPNIIDENIINMWKNETETVISKGPFREYYRKCETALRYCILNSNIGNTFLIIICAHETFTNVFQIVVEEIWQILM
jgi:hypothetical protein